LKPFHILIILCVRKENGLRSTLTIAAVYDNM